MGARRNFFKGEEYMTSNGVGEIKGVFLCLVYYGSEKRRMNPQWGAGVEPRQPKMNLMHF